MIIDDFDCNNQNKLTVQRSFFVEAGHIPAVGLDMEARSCSTLPVPAGSCRDRIREGQGGNGVVHFRYDPIPPTLHP